LFPVAAFPDDNRIIDLQLKRAILDSLRQQAYLPPNTPNCTVRDQFFTEAASHVMDRLKAEGWVMLPPKTKYRGEGHPATLWNRQT
jgi:hypothetical protein